MRVVHGKRARGCTLLRALMRFRKGVVTVGLLVARREGLQGEPELDRLAANSIRLFTVFRAGCNGFPTSATILQVQRVR